MEILTTKILGLLLFAGVGYSRITTTSNNNNNYYNTNSLSTPNSFNTNTQIQLQQPQPYQTYQSPQEWTDGYNDGGYATPTYYYKVSIIL